MASFAHFYQRSHTAWSKGLLHPYTIGKDHSATALKMGLFSHFLIR